MSYAYTHLKHKTITNIRIFMHSYNELIQLLMLIQTYTYSDLPSELQSLLPVLTIELILVLLILYLLRTYTYSRLILISRRMHTYIDFLVCETELIHILIRRYLSTNSYLYLF